MMLSGDNTQSLFFVWSIQISIIVSASKEEDVTKMLHVRHAAPGVGRTQEACLCYSVMTKLVRDSLIFEDFNAIERGESMTANAQQGHKSIFCPSSATVTARPATRSP